LPWFAGSNFAAESNNLTHNKGSFKCRMVVDDDAVHMITSHADDEISFGNVFAFDAATFVLGEIKAPSSESFDGMVGCWPAPTKSSS
jgi:hypothetical protein